MKEVNYMKTIPKELRVNVSLKEIEEELSRENRKFLCWLHRKNFLKKKKPYKTKQASYRELFKLYENCA